MGTRVRSLTTLTMGILLTIGSAAGGEVCHLMLNGCPQDYDGMIVNVPTTAVAIHPEVRFCPPDVSFQGLAKVEASIMLVIDDSPSMMQNDPGGNRYAVTKEILDEIVSVSPKTRVGVVVFRNWLAWDHRQDNLYQKIRDTSFTWNDSYLPLTRLDTVFTDGDSGIVKIKEALATKTDTYSGGLSFTHLANWHHDSTERSRPMCGDQRCAKNQMGTDITLAFLAAKDAMEDSPTPAQRQFVIFLSDGLPGRIDAEMESRKWEFQDGDGVPTTFTVFLNDSVQDAPPQLTQMTDNIQDNRYSKANPNSEIWSVETSHDTLLSLMKQAILTQVFKAEVLPVRSSFGNDTSSSATDTSFLFADFYPLEVDTTSIDMSLVFSYTDTAGVADSAKGDTTVASKLKIVRNPSATWAGLPSGITRTCYQRDMQLYYGGNPVSGYINNSQNPLQVRATLDGVSSAGSAQVSNADNSDAVSVPLSAGDSLFTGNFSRELSNSTIAGDNTLQHGLQDSAIVVWRNPSVPLDTMRVAYPILAYDPVEISSVSYLDQDSDGYIDAIEVKTSPMINLKELDSLTADRFDLPSHRKLTYKGATMNADSSGFLIQVEQDRTAEINTTVDASKDILEIKWYDAGPYDNYVSKGSYPIEDRLPPVVVRVVYAPATLEGGKTDALKVQFSEPLNEINHTDTPLQFVDAGGTSYVMTLESISADNTQHQFRVRSILPAGTVPARGDSVWISPTASVGDPLGNVQDRKSHPVSLEVEYPPYTYEVYAGPNPFKAGEPANAQVPGVGNVGTGTVIVVQSTVPTQESSSKVNNVKIDIYDGVANLVRSGLRPKSGSQNDGNFYIVWDGTNENGRLVGAGGYLAVVSVTATNDKGKKKTTTRRYKLGVRR